MFGDILADFSDGSYQMNLLLCEVNKHILRDWNFI